MALTLEYHSDICLRYINSNLFKKNICQLTNTKQISMCKSSLWQNTTQNEELYFSYIPSFLLVNSALLNTS